MTFGLGVPVNCVNLGPLMDDTAAWRVLLARMVDNELRRVDALADQVAKGRSVTLKTTTPRTKPGRVEPKLSV